MTRKILPYGCWPSTISADLVAGKSLRLGALQADGGSVFWTEGRPDEGGRGAIMRAQPTGEIEEILPAPWSARSKVHEYGGGEFLAAEGRLFFVEADTQDIHELTEKGKPQRLTQEPDLRFADLVLDNRHDRLIAVAERHIEGLHNPENFLAHISLNPANSSSVKTLATGHDFYASPRLSPDGCYLAWLAWDLPHMPWESASLHVAELKNDGSLGEITQIAGGDGSAVFQPEWLADGSLAFVWDKDGLGRLYLWQDGAITEPVSPQGLELMRPQWVFGMQSWTRLADGRIATAFIEQGETWLGIIDLHNSEVSRLQTSLRAVESLAAYGDGLAAMGASDISAPSVIYLGLKGEETVLRSTGEHGLEKEDISVGEVLRFSNEGEDVYALSYPPANASVAGPEDERPPTIILAHGGPTGMADRGLKLKIQYWTNRGFAVCDLDYSGSAGYGRAYRERLNGQWGIRDVEDVAALVKFLSSSGRADPDRFLISGGSAGGYTVLMALAMLDCFAAGSCTYGVSDLSQLQRITHKFEAGYLYGLTGTTEETCEPVFTERSPVNHADKIACPVIFFQGLEDKVVPPQQSQTMVASLRARGVPAVYKEFESEGHGFRRAETLIEVLESEYAFYARVLGLPVEGTLPDLEIENLA